MNEKRKSIFITGAASGMGQAAARLFAENGWFVGIVDVNEKGLDALASEIGSENCYASTLDVTDRGAFQSVLAEFDSEAGGRLDVLFSNAGIIKNGLFGEMDFSDIEKILQVNLMGVVISVHAAYSLLKKTPNSLCFITSSSSAIFGAPNLAAYSTSKHAVKGLTEALSVEFSLIDSRAADAQPGLIETGMMPEGAKDFLPTEGPWRVLPAKAVADVVWASYHDTTGKLHWYVPEDLMDLQQAAARDVEAERDRKIREFGGRVRAMASAQGER
jgi:NAD(P)-dependent dehydrogenase (short-subunit alcohol dehydrogenase family)